MKVGFYVNTLSKPCYGYIINNDDTILFWAFFLGFIEQEQHDVSDLESVHVLR